MEDRLRPNFSNPTLSDFFNDFFGIDIFDEKYASRSGSRRRNARILEHGERLSSRTGLGVIFDNWTKFKG